MEESSNPSFDVKDEFILNSKEDESSETTKPKEPENVDLLTGIEPMPSAGETLHDDTGNRFVSTSRPLVTAVDEEEKNSGPQISEGSDNLSDQVADISDAHSAINASSFANEPSPVPVPQSIGDAVSIDESSSVFPAASESGSVRGSSLGTLTSDKEYESVAEDLLPSVKDPKIGTKLISETTGIKETSLGACEAIAHSAAEKSHSAMEAEVSGSASSKTDGCCPFSPGVWFDPEKLHPCVAELIYWRDAKKSGIAFGSTLALLLSLKYFSCISVAAYLTVAVLGITMSFRIYKTVLQAVQKSNEGHPFKEYLDMNIELSHEKLKDVSEVMIHHVNSVTNKLRSLVLVEDFFDTCKLLVFAWFMTYIGAWLNGMTVIILAFISAFTLPKVYETNKNQIDAYAEVIRTKGKEVMEMVNAKIPLGKKKKEE